MMKTYRTFEEYMYDNYYDAIYNKVKGFLFQKKGASFLSTNLIPDVIRFELDDYHVAGVTFNTPGNDALHFRLSINADVNVWTCQEMCSRRIPKILDRQISSSVMSQPC